MKKFLTAMMALLLSGTGIALAFYVSREQVSDAGGPPVSQALLVEVAEATRGPIRKSAHFIASVEPVASVTILPKITGLLKEITVDLGDYVDAGAVLAVIEDDEYQHQVMQAEANVALAKAQLAQKRIGLESAIRERDRADAAKKRGVSTEQAWESAVASGEMAQAEVLLGEAEISRANAALEEARSNLANTTITAPLAGYVDKRRVEPGALVSSSTPMLTLVKVDPVKIVISVPQRDLDLAQVGRPATIAVAGMATAFTGDIVQVAPTIDVATRTTTVVVTVENRDRALLPGMSVDVNLIAEEKASVVQVPETALLRDASVTQVMVVTEGEVVLKDIRTGIIAGGHVEVLDGLEAGVLVVTKGQYMAEAGDKVRYSEPDREAQ
jgi:RND family efflux transporter MFP subunit